MLGEVSTCLREDLLVQRLESKNKTFVCGIKSHLDTKYQLVYTCDGAETLIWSMPFIMSW